jgi:lipoprotein-releasing system permease protein
MYKLLLCWRYLRTRFLAVLCIVSVMLGVATLIVVNSVMSGFSMKLKDRLHGLISDIVIETPNYNGFPIPAEEMIRMIENSPAGEHIAAMAPTIEIFAMFSYTDPNTRQKVTRPVHLCGVDPKRRAAIGGFAEHLTDPERRQNPSFELSDFARLRFEARNPLPPEPGPAAPQLDENALPPIDPPPAVERAPKGMLIGWAIGVVKDKDPETHELKDYYILTPGDVVNILTVGAGTDELRGVYSPFVVAGYYRSDMAEYDSHYVFVPLDYLQSLRGMDGGATHIQIKLKDYEGSKKKVTEELRALFPSRYGYQVNTWEEKQGAIIAAIDVERGILNLLLFLIVGVAGFSILAIFSMIVSEKTRDIGILKSLGASNRGVMSIFLGYGLLLGLVGCALGTVLGLEITIHINEIEQWLTKLTGRQLFDRSIYYFDSIPTNIEPLTVFLLDAGAVGIAVLFSVLPALRAALLHPVRALRYE